MSNVKMLKWSIMLVIAAGSLSSWVNGASVDAAEGQRDRSQEPMAEETSPEEQIRIARSPVRAWGFQSELQGDLPFAHDLGLPGQKLSARRKRGSGVVIRGPFYPYPRPGHPLRFTSGGPGAKSSSSSSLIVVSLLMVTFITSWRAW